MTENNTIETDNFRMPQWKLLCFLFMKYFKWPAIFFIISLCLLALILSLCGVKPDIRWIILLMMIIFIIIPAVISVIYLKYATMQGIYFNTTQHKVKIKNGFIYICMQLTDYDGDKADKYYKELIFPYEKPVSMIADSEGVRINLYNVKKGFCWIPYSAFKSADDLRIMINLFGR